ncbi:ATP/GTP-binding protein [Streptomyces sp. NPDC002073]
MLKPSMVLGAAALTIASLLPANPGTPNTDCDGQWVCVPAEDPGKPGGGAGGASGGGTGGSGGSDGGGSSQKPHWECSYKLADPQPPENSLDWEGHKPGDGAVYEERCFWTEGSKLVIIRMVWAANPPESTTVDPAVLAQQALDKMLLRPPEIGITPKPGGKGVLGMPVYLWTTTGPETYGPNSASASAGSVTVTATARVSKIVWSMGDGETVICTTAGTPYKPQYGIAPSPDCGHRYEQPSSTTRTGKFHVTATSTWTIDWQVTGGGQTGQLSEVRTSSVDITVAEVQVVN